MPLDPQSLFETGKCFTCFGASAEDVLELALLSTLSPTGANPLLPTLPTHPLALSWQARVQTNGGSVPSAASVAAISTFCYALDAAGVTSLIITLNVFAPDSFISCLTPLIVGAGGTDPWNNPSNLFQAADLSVNGLQGNGTTKFLATTVNPALNYSNDTSASLFVYESTTDAVTTCPIGCFAAAAANDFALFTNSFGAGIFLFDCWNNTDNQGRCVVNPGPTLAGFYLGTRTASNLSSAYFANSTNPWSLKGTNVGGPIGAHTDPNHDLGIFCINGGGGQFFFSDRKISGAGMGFGMTSAQGQALYNAFQALRQSFGGGFV